MADPKDFLARQELVKAAAEAAALGKFTRTSYKHVNPLIGLIVADGNAGPFNQPHGHGKESWEGTVPLLHAGAAIFFRRIPCDR